MADKYMIIEVKLDKTRVMRGGRSLYEQIIDAVKYFGNIACNYAHADQFNIYVAKTTNRKHKIPLTSMFFT